MDNSELFTRETLDYLQSINLLNVKQLRDIAIKCEYEKEKLKRRNCSLILSELADKYFMSADSLRQIIYTIDITSLSIKEKDEILTFLPLIERYMDKKRIAYEEELKEKEYLSKSKENDLILQFGGSK